MTLDRYLVKQFFPVFIISILMFVLLLGMIDLFSNLVRYLNHGVSTFNIFMLSFYYIPKSLSYALPLSLLFATAYTVGYLYSKNELTSIYASGIPFRRFCLSLVFLGLSASIFSFFFNDIIVIPTFKIKNDLSRTYLNEPPSGESRTDIVIRARGGRLTYAVDYFDHRLEVLNGLSIIEYDNEGRFLYQIRARSASWTGTHWELYNAVIYEWVDGILRYRTIEGVNEYRESPDTFRRNMVNVEELSFVDAYFLVNDLQSAGLPFLDALTDFHHRLSFATVSFLVIFLSISMGGRFKKNILLMSLLSSLGTAVIFYVMEMISMMLARTGYISPLSGAWFPVAFFTFIGFILLRTAKT